MSKTMSQLKTAVRDIIDEDQAAAISDNQLGRWLNASLGHLHDMLINIPNSNMFVERDAYQVTTTADQHTYSIPDVKCIVAVDFKTGDNYYHVDKASLRERNFYQSNNPTYYPPITGMAWRWCSVGDDHFRIMPTPNGTYNFYVWYVAKLAELDDTDTTPLGIEDSWLDWAVFDAAIKCKVRTEESIQELMALKADVENRIRRAVRNRAQGVEYAPDMSKNNLMRTI